MVGCGAAGAGCVRPGRVIGCAGGERAGPTLVCVAALHGNEPSGVAALERVFAALARERIALRGRLVGLTGNLGALARGRRFLAGDLNRLWTPARIGRLRRAAEGGAGGGGCPAKAGAPAPGRAEIAEEVEQRELFEALQAAIAHARGEVLVIDLHTASSATPPFLILGDTLRNRAFARRFPAAIVLGLEEQLEGTLGEFVTGLGHVSVSFEAGRHDDPQAAERHEALVWLALLHAGVLEETQVPELERRRALLDRRAAGLPQVLEVFHRHPVRRGDGFAMRAGFRNFHPVRAGEILASDRKGEIRAPARGLLFFPLYQGLGEDGFFLARRVNPLWLTVSGILRRSRLPRLVPMLPGVRRVAGSRGTLVIDPRVARFLRRGVLHLLGFRLHPPRRGHWVARRRPGEGEES